MDLGPLLGLWLQSSIIGVTMWALGIVIFVLVYGRMLEIYLLTSLAPIPMATISHREVGQIGQNYLRSLFARRLPGAAHSGVCCDLCGADPGNCHGAEIPLGRFGAPWAIRFCSASCCSKLGRLREVSLAHIEKGVLYAEKIWARRVAPVERESAEDFNQADVYRFMAETESVLQKQELLGGRDNAKKIAQQLAEGRGAGRP